MMDVLYLTHRLPYAPDRGDRIRSYHTLRVLSQVHRVHLLSLVHSREEELRAAEMGDLASTVHVCRVRPTPIALGRGLGAIMWRRAPLTHVLLDSPAIRRALEQVLERNRIDVVLAYCSGMAQFAVMPPLTGLPWVLDMVDVDSEKWRALGTKLGPRQWIYRREAATLRRFEDDAVRQAFATSVVNERERALLREAEERVVAIANGIDVDTFRRPADLGHQPGAVQVVFSGVFSYAPNAQAAEWLAKSVWPHVLTSKPHARLVLAGAEPPRTLRQLATANGSITVTGRVPDIRPFLWDSCVAVAPLQLSRGVQNKVLEAVAAGLTCVVTPPVAAGLPPAILPACSVADDPIDFSRAVLARLDQPRDERERTLAQLPLRQLSWEAQLHPLVQLLERAAQAPAQRAARAPADPVRK